jgi:hypothetical protein
MAGSAREEFQMQMPDSRHMTGEGFIFLVVSVLAGMCWGRDKYSIAAGVAMLILVAIVYSVWVVRWPSSAS